MSIYRLLYIVNTAVGFTDSTDVNNSEVGTPQPLQSSESSQLQLQQDRSFISTLDSFDNNNEDDYHNNNNNDDNVVVDDDDDDDSNNDDDIDDSDHDDDDNDNIIYLPAPKWTATEHSQRYRSGPCSTP